MRDCDHSPTVVMKLDRREWLANPRDGTGTVYVFTGSCGMGREWNHWNGMGLVFISIPNTSSSNTNPDNVDTLH